ncbi:MAG: hypothetical protein ACU0A4_17040 [Paracoccaceae bacterium]
MPDQKPTISRKHLDLLLMMIIRANAHPRKREADRLRDAREALFGEKGGQGRPTSYDDLALFKLASELQKREIDGLRYAMAKYNGTEQTPEWKEEVAREPKSVHAAAQDAAKYAGNDSTDNSAKDRLRRKVRGRKFSSAEMAEGESLFDPDDRRTRAIINILNLFKQLGVESGSIWDENP